MGYLHRTSHRTGQCSQIGAVFVRSYARNRMASLCFRRLGRTKHGGKDVIHATIIDCSCRTRHGLANAFKGQLNSLVRRNLSMHGVPAKRCDLVTIDSPPALAIEFEGAHCLPTRPHPANSLERHRGALGAEAANSPHAAPGWPSSERYPVARPYCCNCYSYMTSNLELQKQ